MAATAQSYTVKTLHFLVSAGPPSAERQCNIVGDLYRPADATASHPDPAVLTTNGFGGSKDDQAAFGQELASEGYVVLSYSGLGFGGSGCPIELDDPDWDGRAASQLITFLGGGLAATEQDPRLDTIVPIITWNDLTYSLAPNNAGLPSTVPSDTVSNSVPGVAKFIWLNAFFGEGAAADGLQQLSNDPTADLTGRPNFNAQVCSAAIQTSATGAPPDSAIALLRHASVESYMSKIRIPTLLAQALRPCAGLSDRHRPEPRAVGVGVAGLPTVGRAERAVDVRDHRGRRADQLQRDLGRRVQRGAWPGAL